MHQKVEAEGISFGQPYLEDVETLNRWAIEPKLDVTKLSFHALAYVLDDYCLLSAGSALGRGCGPLLVSAGPIEPAELVRKKVAIPGRYTTAAFLFRLFLPDCTDVVEMRFDNIMEAVKTGAVDAGVIIHESRFTYEGLGLVCLRDLGDWWEETTNFPIPLGCIAARRSLGSDKVEQIDRAIRASVKWGHANPDLAMVYIRDHAQELSQDVIGSHVKLYVNDFSQDLGDGGMLAIDHFLKMGRESGILPDTDRGFKCK